VPDTATDYTLPADKTLMILDDDGPFRNRLGRALTNRGFEVTTVETVLEANLIATNNPPAFAVLDMRLEDGNGLGAVDYLAKPADADDVCKALLAPRGETPMPPENPMSADRVRWEHIQRVYELCGKNVSETARRLNMHRRTLQRILAKRAPR